MDNSGSQKPGSVKGPIPVQLPVGCGQLNSNSTSGTEWDQIPDLSGIKHTTSKQDVP